MAKTLQDFAALASVDNVSVPLRHHDGLARRPVRLDVASISAIVFFAAVLCAVAAWAVRRSALRALEGPAPTAQEFAAAALAGKRLAAGGVIGLVLAGGGAKGAYQVGCWKALRECGVAHFGPIAGTSVGALNAVLVAQDDFAKAQAIWYDMSFGRVLRLRLHAVVAVALRLVLFLAYLGKLKFPARAIPVPMWRAVSTYRAGTGDPTVQLAAALQLYKALLGRQGIADMASNLVLTVIAIGGFSAWWMLATPLLAVLVLVVLAPLAALLVVTYTSWLVEVLDLLSTRLVLATNEPLHRLLLDCVDVAKLKSLRHPLFVTLASLREVQRTVLPKPKPKRGGPAPKPSAVAETAPALTGWRRWWRDNVTGGRQYSSDYARHVFQDQPHVVPRVEYAPTHFQVNNVSSGLVHELILQSAGLPEIFPARRFDEHTYVDGGIADNVPLAALARPPLLAELATIIVMPLDASADEAEVRQQLADNLERIGAPNPAVWPKLLVLTPACSLGNFAVGTLDFSATRARALLTAGYRDTIKRLAREGT